MKVLITGGTGLIGSSVIREALAEGYEVRALKRPDSDLRNLNGLDIEYVDGDLLDRDSLEHALKGCQKLYQIAALYRHWHPKGGDFIRRTNIEGTTNILECALKHDLEKVIYTSSISSVGFYPDRLSTEEDFPKEEDCRRQPYRDSKFRSEKIAFEYADKMPITIVNPASPIGVRDNVPTPTGRTILDFLNGKMVAYVDVGMNFIDVEDLAQGYIQSDKKGKNGERYILGNYNTFLKDFFENIADLTGLKAPSTKVPKPIVRVMAEISEVIANITKKPPVAAVEQALHTHYNEFVDCSKAVNELGLPQNDIRIAIYKAVKYYLELGSVLPKRKRMIQLQEPV